MAAMSTPPCIARRLLLSHYVTVLSDAPSTCCISTVCLPAQPGPVSLLCLLLLLLLLLPAAAHRKLSLSRKLPCGKCNGTGSRSGKRDQCETCHGTGVQVTIRPIGPGMVQQIQQPCRDCSGNGFCAKPSKRRKGLVLVLQ